jgi:tetratricopeptide (TPR) repeat protein
MARRISRKEIKEDEFIEKTLDVGVWIEKNWKAVATGIGAVLLLVVAIALWQWWSVRRAEEVRDLLGEGISLYRTPQSGGSGPAGPDYAKALATFEKAVRAAGDSLPGETARFYHAATLVQLGRGSEAVPALEKLAEEATTREIVDSARAVLAEAYGSSGQLDKAVATYRKLVDVAGSTYPADLALLNIGRLLQKQGKIQDARQTWQDLLAKYPQGGSAQEAKQLLQEAGTQP